MLTSNPSLFSFQFRVYEKLRLKPFYISVRYASFFFSSCQNPLNRVEQSVGLNITNLLEKKMEFKAKSKNIFFKKNIDLFFSRPKKPIRFFGLKFSKNKNTKFFKKTQIKLQELNFTNKNLFSINRDLGLNPYFGGVSRGFSKLLVKVQLKEYLNAFLRPKWYRLSKFQNFKLSILKKKMQAEFLSNIYSNSNFFNNSNFYFFHTFFIKKRWFLLYVLKNDKKI